MKLQTIKEGYENRGREYKIFSANKFFCFHDMVEHSAGCMDPTESYQCKKCGLIITDDSFNDGYYRKQVDEYEAH